VVACGHCALRLTGWNIGTTHVLYRSQLGARCRSNRLPPSGRWLDSPRTRGARVARDRSDNRGIASRLGVSLFTVQHHLTSVHLKLGCRDRARAIVPPCDVGCWPLMDSLTPTVSQPRVPSSGAWMDPTSRCCGSAIAKRSWLLGLSPFTRELLIVVHATTHRSSSSR
jgi:hypothetical protein